MDKVIGYTEKTKKVNSLNFSKEATWVLENGNWILKPLGKVAEYANRPANTVYHNLVKPYYKLDRVSEGALNDSEKANSNILSVIDYTGKASDFVAVNQLTRKNNFFVNWIR